MRTRGPIAAAAASALLLGATACAVPAQVPGAPPAPQAPTAPTAAPTIVADPVTAGPTGPTATTGAPDAPASVAPGPAATGAAEADPLAGWQEIVTPNGTATFRIPPDWSADVGGGDLVDYDGFTRWSNSIVISDADGARQLRYWDGPGDDVGASSAFGVVAQERIATLDAEELAAAGGGSPYLEHWARAWWDGGADGGEVRAHVAVTPQHAEGEPPSAAFSDGHRLISFGALRTMASEEAAIEWLESDEAARLFEIVRTLDLHGAPVDAMPLQG